ncbi:MAG: hypothetical protein K2Q32_01820 [Alphaproteobacteria bacterium]|nr:hypothetical protein [Alphaproteobacteria bacterium]
MHGKVAEIGDNSGDVPVQKTVKPAYSSYMGTPNSAFDEDRLRREDPRWFNTAVTADEAEKRAEWARFNMSPLTSTPPGGSKEKTSGGFVTHIVHPRAIDDTGPIETIPTAAEIQEPKARAARTAMAERARRQHNKKHPRPAPKA